MVREISEHNKWGLCLRPNCSATKGQVYAFISVIALLSFSIALAWASLGFWPVIPFAGFEVSLVGWLLIANHRKAQRQQMIMLDGDQLVLGEGGEECEHTISMRQKEVFLQVNQPTSCLASMDLYLIFDDRKCSVGSFLVEDEKVLVWESLKGHGIRDEVLPWWYANR